MMAALRWVFLGVNGGRGGGTRTEAAVLLMGHLDVWAYVIQSQCAASNGPTIAGVLLRADRSAAKPPPARTVMAQATGAAGS